jgi:hypothetical protein
MEGEILWLIDGDILAEGDVDGLIDGEILWEIL